MRNLTIGSTVGLKNRKTAYIKDKLGEGGQGNVYLVAIDNRSYALKWYHKKIENEEDKFYSNLANNI